MNGAMGRKMESEMIGWIDAKVKKMLADACAEGTPPEQQKRTFLIVGMIAIALAFVVFPVLLILFYVCINLVFG